jgi:hypothetical protein
MHFLVVQKRQTRPRTCLLVEELETRALLSTLPIWQTAQSTNWSGYGAETNLAKPAANAVTMVSGSWTVPTVTGRATAYSSVWVGIDGYSSSSNSVEQLGTEQDTSSSGKATYYAWWEMYPNPSVRIAGLKISPGDAISASVTYDSGAFTLQITDNTTKHSFTTTQSSATAQRSSAEWIVEAPSSFFGVLPLANFGTAKISAAQATINGTTGAIDNGAWQSTSIDMVSNSGTPIDQTSGLTDTAAAPITSSFSVQYTGSISGGGHGGGNGGGHGGGNGTTEAALLVVPSHPAFQATATPDTFPNPMTDRPVASAEQNQFLTAPAVDTFFAQVQEHEATLALKTAWGLPTDIREDSLDSDMMGSDEV